MSNKQANTPTPELLTQLYQHDVIDDSGYRFSQEQFLPALQWRQWILRLCIGLGTALLLLGIVFFFAYNWHAMPKWSKLALIEVAMLLSFGGAVLFGTRKLLGQCLLLAGTVFIGVFFAVFGQIYQTGADAWQLFALWAVLMFGFLWASRFYAQWILQWSITGLAIFLWLTQSFYWSYRTDWTPMGMMAIYTLAVWGLQIGLGKRNDWLNTAWLRVVTLLIAHAWLIVAAIIALFDDGEIGFIIAVATVAGLLWWHMQKRFDLLSQVIATTTLGILAWTFILYLLLENMKLWRNEIAIVTIMLIVTIVLSVGIYQTVIALKNTMAKQPEKHNTIEEN